jgi:XTP/dITP diphosphohydrolase
VGLPEKDIQLMKLIFASNNKHKIEELRACSGNEIEIVSLNDAGINIEIPEPHDTLEANASEKSWTIYRLTGENCFSEDTGLEIDALNSEPGVKSARYAGEEKLFQKNIGKVLEKMKGHTNRKARFRAVISLIMDGKEWLFEGICPGKILNEPRGNSGFGYDPVFMPEGSDHSFAEMTMTEKNQFNHRVKAAEKMVAFLQTLITKTSI